MAAAKLTGHPIFFRVSKVELWISCRGNYAFNDWLQWSLPKVSKYQVGLQAVGRLSKQPWQQNTLMKDTLTRTELLMS